MTDGTRDAIVLLRSLVEYGDVEPTLSDAILLNAALRLEGRYSRYRSLSHAATCRRALQFEAGPERLTFYACEEHRAKLERGDVTCFYAVEAHPVEEVSLADEVECDLCREG